MRCYEITIREKDGTTKTTEISGTSDTVAAMVMLGTALRAESRGAEITDVREKPV